MSGSRTPSPFAKRGSRVVDCLLEATDALGYAFLP
jgi:hypothetical protein